MVHSRLSLHRFYLFLNFYRFHALKNALTTISNGLALLRAEDTVTLMEMLVMEGVRFDELCISGVYTAVSSIKIETENIKNRSDSVSVSH